VRFLLDTHLLIWAAESPEILSESARKILEDQRNSLVFSACSIWEIAIKYTQRRKDFLCDPREFRDELQAYGFQELSITSNHAIAVAALPLIHKDPFDRILVAQAAYEKITLLTSDALLARYPGPIMLV
jgi:PIN domain nuclease of toxin-antitoxin system